MQKIMLPQYTHTEVLHHRNGNHSHSHSLTYGCAQEGDFQLARRIQLQQLYVAIRAVYAWHLNNNHTKKNHNQNAT